MFENDFGTKWPGLRDDENKICCLPGQLYSSEGKRYGRNRIVFISDKTAGCIKVAGYVHGKHI